MTATHTERIIRVICPICKSDKEIDFPNSIINQAKQLTTVSVPTGMVCEHHFQMFIDKNFQVRGYQKVDFELKAGSGIKSSKDNEDNLFDNLVMEGNYLEWKPNGNSKSKIKEPEMTIKDIYDEFWELIDDTNEEFKEFIKIDKRRKILKSKHTL